MANKKNVSSGAEKAEKLASKPAKKTEKKSAVKSVQGGKDSKKKPVKSKRPLSDKKLQKIKKREEKKLEIAKIKAEKKQKRLEKKLEAKQKRLDRIAAMKEKKQERKAKRQERKDMLKSETKAMRDERKAEERQAYLAAKTAKREAKAAERQARREHRLKVRAEKRAERNEKRHAPGFGGWFAAVIALGVTTLALGTVLTFGWINMNGMQADMASVHTQSLYELNSVVDNLDANLARARASSSASDRARVLSDIAVESEMAEMLLERLPLDIQSTEKMTGFINRMGDSAKQMLYTVADGGELSSSQLKSIEYMYKTNLKLKRALNEVIANTDGNDMLNAISGKASILGDAFTDIQNNAVQTPKGIHDGPFADSIKKTNAAALEGLEEISAPRAEQLAKEYFADYKFSDVRCTGEAVAKGFSLYNIVFDTPDGEMLAQLSKKGGKVVMFDSFKDCSDKNFSVERCVAIAEDFLKDIGYGEMKAVWTSENGTTCNLNFAPEQDGVILYTDLVKVKVCEERGIVTGMESLAYVINHGERDIGSADIGEEQARSNINGNIDVQATRLSLIPFEDEEILCYEFYGELDGNEYYVYVDAATGEEIEVLTVIGTAQGRALM